MDSKETCSDWAVWAAPCEKEIRKGPWTMEEEFKLLDCLAIRGAGRWNYLAHYAGLKRTRKSCRLRWLNYLHPDVKRGNLALQEQILILELHSLWGNRWSKIAQYLPGRTDNKIKNYWRTRVEKLAKQLKCDVNGIQFRETMRNLWLPTLVDRVPGPLSAQFSMSTGFSCDHTAVTVTAMAAGYVVPNGLTGMDDLKHNTKPEISGASSRRSKSLPLQASLVGGRMFSVLIRRKVLSTEAPLLIGTAQISPILVAEN